MRRTGCQILHVKSNNVQQKFVKVVKVEEENIYNVFKYLYKKNWTVIQGGIAAVAIFPPSA